MRTICEQKAGLQEAAGADEIDEIIGQVWDKILYTKTPIFDESYRETLFCKILKHYYMWEIGFETVGEWIYNINMDLEELLPYFNKLYQSELLAIEPLINFKTVKNVSRETLITEEGHASEEKSGTINSDTTNTGNSTDINSHNTTEKISSSDSRNVINSGSDSNRNIGTVTDDYNDKFNASDDFKRKFSDTPQGTLTGVETGTYLTEAAVENRINGGNKVSKNISSTDVDNIVTYGLKIDDNVVRDNSKTDTGTDEKNSTKNDKIVGKTDSSDTINSENSKTGNQNETAWETTSGFSGKSQSELLLEYRDTFINIDMLLIDRLKNNFMLIW